MVEKDWVLSISAHGKIGLYAMLGASITFALTFTIVDLMNYVVSLWDKRPFVNQSG